MDAEELAPRLAVATKFQGRDIESLRGEGLVDGDVDAAKPRPIHTHKRRKVGASIDDRDVHRLTSFLRLHDPRFNDPLRSFRCHHDCRTPGSRTVSIGCPDGSFRSWFEISQRGSGIACLILLLWAPIAAF